MKKQNFIALFVSVQIILLFLQIHQHTSFINQSFAKQKNEKIKAELEQRKQEVAHELAIARDYETIQKFAAKKLHMRPVALSQIKKLPSPENKSDIITRENNKKNSGDHIIVTANNQNPVHSKSEYNNHTIATASKQSAIHNKSMNNKPEIPTSTSNRKNYALLNTNNQHNVIHNFHFTSSNNHDTSI